MPGRAPWVAFRCMVSLAALGCGRSELGLFDVASDSVGSGGAVGVSTVGGQGAGGSGEAGAGGMGATGVGGAGMGGGGQAPEPVVGWANSRTELFALLDGIGLSSVGDFVDCYGDVLDVAVDEGGTLYVTTPAAVYRVDGATALCTELSQGTYPNSLTVVPPGVVDPEESALVGFETDTYLRIDKSSGAATILGSLGTTGFYSSGDVVLHLGRMYLSLSGGSCFDCLAEVNRETGALLQVVGPIGFNKVFGLVSLSGTLYGFTNAGQVLAIDPFTGMGTPVSELGAEFWGAARYP